MLWIAACCRKILIDLAAGETSYEWKICSISGIFSSRRRHDAIASTEMSAYWEAIGIDPAGIATATLTWGDRRSPPYVCVIHHKGSDVTSAFASLSEVDAWVSQYQVKSWRLTRLTRCFPHAALLPMSFPDAPIEEILQAALSRLQSGEKMKDVANDLGVHPSQAIAWIIGFAPQDKGISAMRRGRARE